MNEDASVRKGCVAVGYGGEVGAAPWHVMWLPKGYAVTAGDRMVCYFAEPQNSWSKSYGLKEGHRPPLIEAVCKAIEQFMAEHPDHEIGTPAWPDLVKSDEA